jgi:hypothetical protein
MNGRDKGQRAEWKRQVKKKKRQKGKGEGEVMAREVRVSVTHVHRFG